MKRWLIVILSVVGLAVLIGFAKFRGTMKMFEQYAAMGEPKSTVSTVKAAYDTWQPEVKAVGTLRAVRGVDLAAEVAGLVKAVNVRSGSEAKGGDVLVQMVIDSDVARLDSLKASAELAKTTGDRASKQFEAQAISQAQLDTQLAQQKSAEAAVAEQQGLIVKKTIRAPFSGQLGISTVNPGQYLNPGDKVVTLQQLDPIYVDFNLPQGSIGRVRPGMSVTATSDSFPGETFKGEVSAINPVVDPDTRNVRVQATLKNPSRKLLPGMFTDVVVASGEPQRFLTLPSNAVAFNPYGETVFVIVPRGQENAPDPNKPAELVQTEALKKADAELKAEQDKAQGKKEQQAPQMPQQEGADQGPKLVARQVFISVGLTRGDQVAVLKGLKEGDEVVTSGQLKLKNGTLVQINNDVQPANDADPHPVDN